MRSILALVLFALVLAGCRHAETARPSESVQLRLLAINDFHGNLEPTPGASKQGAPSDLAGGALPLAAVIARLRLEQPNSLLVAAGDLVGASPLISALQRDEPTIAFLNHVGLSVSAVGNHELDQGLTELMRLQKGGCPPVGCVAGEPVFAGAQFTYLSANLIDQQSGLPVFAPYRIVSIDGVRIAFIGALVRSAADVVLAENLVGLQVEDEATRINAVVPEIRAQGVRAIVVLLHEGAESNGPLDPLSCAGLQGPGLSIASQLDAEIDLVISGHTHQAYVCRLSGRLFTQAGSYGHWVTAIDLTLDRDSGDVVDSQAINTPVPVPSASDDPTLVQLLAVARARVAEVAARPIARLRDAQIRRAPEANGESALGRLLADAQLEAALPFGAQLACMNPGGVRQHLPAIANTGGPVTYGDIRATQPFGNRVKVLVITGAQLREMLEQQWQQAVGHIVLSCSNGFTYRFDLARPLGQRVLPDSLRIHGEAMNPQGEYRLAVNNFLAGGGNGFLVLKEARVVGDAGLDLDALINYLRAHEPVATPTQSRIHADGTPP